MSDITKHINLFSILSHRNDDLICDIDDYTIEIDDCFKNIYHKHIESLLSNTTSFNLSNRALIDMIIPLCQFNNGEISKLYGGALLKEASKYFNKNGLFYRIVINSSNNSEGKKFKFGDNSDKILHILKNCVDRIQSKFPNITFNGAFVNYCGITTNWYNEFDEINKLKSINKYSSRPGFLGLKNKIIYYEPSDISNIHLYFQDKTTIKK